MDRILSRLGASVSALFSPVKCELQYISEQDQLGVIPNHNQMQD
jgi:hypothetical protein